jgi:MoxR-like ATPase
MPTKPAKKPDASNLFDLPTAPPAPSAVAKSSVTVTVDGVERFRTDDEFYFGFRRQTPVASTPTRASLAGYRADPRYDIYRKANLAGKPIWLISDPGAGKTVFAQDMACNTGLPYLEIVHDAEWLPENVLGRPVQDSTGRWVYEDGELIEWFAHGGYLMLDELAAVKGSLSQFWHPWVANPAVWVRTKAGIVQVPRHKNCFIIAASNDWNRDRTNYEPGRPLLDRFLLCNFTYMSFDHEVGMLAERAPSVSPGQIKDLVTFANQWRDSLKSSPDTIRLPMSTRTLINTVDVMHDLALNLNDAIGLAIVEPARLKAPGEVETLLVALRLNFGYTESPV